MDFVDIVILGIMLVGAVMMIIAQVLKHKGMWNLRNDDMPFGSGRRGFESPYEISSVGGTLIVTGLCAELGYTFGLAVGLWSAVIAAVINAAVSVFCLKRVPEFADDKDLRTMAEVHIAVSAFVLLVSGLMLVMI